MAGITLDAGSLIGLDRNDRRVVALIARASQRAGTAVVTSDAGDIARLDPTLVEV